MENRNVELETLDSLFLTDNTYPPPDFLSLDVQGFEYQVLKGSEKLLQDHILGLQLEVSFHPLYQGQKLFGDINKLLNEFGFDFVGFDPRFMEMSPYRYGLGLRGKGFSVSTDALYLKRHGQIGDYLRYEKLGKLAFFSIIFEQFEYGLQCLKERNMINPPSCIAEESLIYLNFLNGLAELVDKDKPIFLKTFDEIYSFEDSKSRFKISPNLKSQYNSFTSPKFFRRQLARINLVRNMYHKMIRIRQALKSKNPLFNYGYSDIEKYLVSYDLRNLADTLKSKRITQLRHKFNKNIEYK